MSTRLVDVLVNNSTANRKNGASCAVELLSHFSEVVDQALFDVFVKRLQGVLGNLDLAPRGASPILGVWCSGSLRQLTDRRSTCQFPPMSPLAPDVNRPRAAEAPNGHSPSQL